MSYGDKYPDMSAMYAIQFEHENKLKNKITELETELERTRKALDVAVDALKKIADAPIGYCMFAEEALEQITAPEQKDVK